MNSSILCAINIPTQNMRCDFTGAAGSISSCVEDMLEWAKTNLYKGKHNTQTIFTAQDAEQLHKRQMLIRKGELLQAR